MGTISTDPIGFSAGDANLYRYVGNKATYRRDPTGLVDLEELREELLKRLEAEKQKAIAAGRIDEADRINRIMGREHTTGPGNHDKHTTGSSRTSKAALKKAASNLAAIEQCYENCISTVKKQPIDWIVADALEEARKTQQELLRQKIYEINHSPGDGTKGHTRRLREKLNIEQALKEIDETEMLLKKQKTGAVRGMLQKAEWIGKQAGKCVAPANIYMEIREPLLKSIDEIKRDEKRIGTIFLEYFGGVIGST